MLMPAGVLVVLLLGAISFDLSLVFLRQRQASSVAVDVANDLASAAFDEARFRSTGAFTLDPARADELGAAFVAGSDLADEVVAIEVDVLGTDGVRVTLTVRVDYVFADAIPGAADGTTVTAHATAVAMPG
jgi:hypothetical protein